MSISKIFPLIFKNILSLIPETNRIGQGFYPIPTTVLSMNLIYLIVSLRLFCLNLIVIHLKLYYSAECLLTY